MPVCTSCKHGRAVERLREAYKRLKERSTYLADLCDDCRKRETERIGEALKQLEPERDALSAICTKCKGASDNFGGQVHIDAAADPMLVLRKIDEANFSNSRLPTSSRVNIDDPEVLETVLRVVAEFGNVTDKQAPILIRKLRGQTNIEIAVGMGISPALVWKLWRGIKLRNQTLAALECGLQGKRGGGAVTHKPKPDGEQAEPNANGEQPQQSADAASSSSHLHSDQPGEVVAENMQPPES